jgi:hypothetical protein
MYGPNITFLGVDECDIEIPESFADADVVIVGAPFDGGTSYRSGARFGPKAMREVCNEEHNGSRESMALRVNGLKDLRVYDMGDVEMYSGDAVKSCENLEKVIEKIAALNIKNEKVLNIINTCYGQKYSAVLNMITNIKTTDAYTNNSNFSDFINNASNSIAVSGNNATSSKIKTYMDAMGAANQMDTIQKSQTEPEESSVTTKPADTTKNAKKGIAVCFVIVDELFHESIWRTWSDSRSSGSYFAKVFIHAKNPSNILSEWVCM